MSRSELPSGWTRDRLGDHATVRGRIGWRGLKADEYTEDGPFLIAGNHIFSAKVQWEQCQHLSQFRYGESPEIALNLNDIIISKDGTIGRVALIDRLPGPATINSTMMLVRVVRPDSLEPEFLFHALQGGDFTRLVDERVSGSSVPHLFQADMKKLEVSFPPLPEQRKIARILSTVDDLIERTEALITKYRAIKQGLMHDLLTRGVDASGRLRPLREEAPELYRESAVGWVPREWEVAPLCTYRDPNKPHIKTGPFGSSLKTEHWVTEGVPVITIGSLGEGEFIDAELLFITESKAATLGQYTVAHGDLVFSRVADVGRSALVGEREDGWIMSSNLMRISLDTTKIVPEHLYLSLVFNPWTRQQIRQSVNAGGREVANTAILERLLFAWPSLDEQLAVATIFRSHEATVRAEQERLDKLQHIKTGLMQDLLTGRVRAKV